MRRIVEYVFYRGLAFLVPLLPRGGMVWLGRRLGWLYLMCSPKARKIGLENLRRAFPDRRDHWAILRESLRMQAVALLDALWSARLTPERAAALVEVDAEEWRRLEPILRSGRGAVVATGHFGSWEMFNLAAGAMGMPKATFIARPVRNARIDAHLKRRRERTGNTLVYRSKALPACLAALRRGEIACSVIDIAVTPAEGGLFVDFLGTPALTSGALPLLAVRRGAPLLFAVCRPLERGRRYALEGVEIPVRAEAPDRDAEVRRLTQELSHALARRIREHPEAWIWSYKRWKWRPSELPGAYPDYSLWAHPLW